MAQIEYFTADKNPNGHDHGKKLHWLPLPTLLFRKTKLKKKKKKKKKNLSFRSHLTTHFVHATYVTFLGFG
jgi:hypothetical protein